MWRRRLARREIGAARQLERQGFRTFLPQMLKTVRHARQLRTVRAAVFPGYVFVALDLARDRWRSVNGTINVSRLIMGEDMPLPVPTGIVEALMAYRDASGLCRLDRDLQPGRDSARDCGSVRAGSWAGSPRSTTRAARGCYWRSWAAA